MRRNAPTLAVTSRIAHGAEQFLALDMVLVDEQDIFTALHQVVNPGSKIAVQDLLFSKLTTTWSVAKSLTSDRTFRSISHISYLMIVAQWRLDSGGRRTDGAMPNEDTIEELDADVGTLIRGATPTPVTTVPVGRNLKHIFYVIL